MIDFFNSTNEWTLHHMNNSPVIKLGQTIKKDLNLNGFFLDMIY